MLSAKEYITHPEKLASTLLYKCGQWLPDKLYIKLLYRFRMGKRLDLNKPQTFSEKLQWLKLYDRNPQYPAMVDKYEAKKYVADIIGEEYVIPTFGVWDTPEDIEWDKLPNKFVLKTTHGGGNTGVVICKDKTTFDKRDAIKKLNESFRQEIYHTLREWPYKKIKKRIIAEQYIDTLPGSNDLPDYKFFCFNGEPVYCQVITGRNTKACSDFFDKKWEHQPFHEPSYYPFADPSPEKPEQYNKMWELARILAKDKAFSRIDFYNVGQKVYFGEITFFPTSGYGGFSPKEYDLIIGNLIHLPLNQE